jgi:hypothetical protein
MRKTIICCFVLCVTACTSSPYPVTSPYYRIPAGSQLVLKQELTIPPNAGRVYIQSGKVVTPKEKDAFYPHCWFLSWDVLDTAQTIKPDTFIVIKTQQLEDLVSNTGPKQTAMNGLALGFLHGSTPMALEYSTEFTIHSESQPRIRRFVCSHWERPDDARHLTVAQMQAVLGNLAEIRLNRGN